METRPKVKQWRIRLLETERKLAVEALYYRIKSMADHNAGEQKIKPYWQLMETLRHLHRGRREWYTFFYWREDFKTYLKAKLAEVAREEGYGIPQGASNNETNN
jgi:hypothetical protein